MIKHSIYRFDSSQIVSNFFWKQLTHSSSSSAGIAFMLLLTLHDNLGQSMYSKKKKEEERKKERKKINREAKMNLAEISIGFVKSCHFPVTSSVAHLVFSWCRMITHQLSSSVRWVIYSWEVSWHSYSCWCPRKDKESQLQWQSRTPVRMSTPRADGCDK